PERPRPVARAEAERGLGERGDDGGVIVVREEGEDLGGSALEAGRPARGRDAREHLPGPPGALAAAREGRVEPEAVGAPVVREGLGELDVERERRGGRLGAAEEARDEPTGGGGALVGDEDGVGAGRHARGEAAAGEEAEDVARGGADGLRAVAEGSLEEGLVG